ALRQVGKSDAPELGLRRISSDDSDLIPSGNPNPNWVHLMDNIAELEVRYFEPRLNAWLEKWTDPNARPSLIQVRIRRADRDDFYEAVLALPPTRITGAPTLQTR